MRKALVLRSLSALGALAVVVGVTWTVARSSAVEAVEAAPIGDTSLALPSRAIAPAEAGEQPMKRTAVQPSAPLPAASSTLPRAGGGIPENVDELAAFNERVNARAQQTAQLVRSLSDMDLVLSQVETEIAQSRQVNAFHVKSSVAAVRAAYRDRPEEELEARLLDLDRRLMELSAKYDPSVREAMVAGAARAH